MRTKQKAQVLKSLFSRWLHGGRRADVLEGHTGPGRRGGRAAPVHHRRVRDERPQRAPRHRHLPASVPLLQAPAQHRLLHLPDLPAQHPHRDAVLGLVLDQPRGDERQGGPRDNHRADHDHHKHGRQELPAEDQLRQGHRHLPGDVLRLRFRRPAGVRGGELHVLGGEGEEEDQEGEGRGGTEGRWVVEMYRFKGIKESFLIPSS